MKKFLLFLFVFLWGDNYLDYVHKIIDYNFKLQDYKTINAPFITKKDHLPNLVISKPNQLQKVVKFKLISVLNNQAQILIKIYVGTVLKKKVKKWVKKGDIIQNCKVVNIKLGVVKLECKNKRIKLSLYKKFLGFKE